MALDHVGHTNDINLFGHAGNLVGSLWSDFKCTVFSTTKPGILISNSLVCEAA